MLNAKPVWCIVFMLVMMQACSPLNTKTADEHMIDLGNEKPGWPDARLCQTWSIPVDADLPKRDAPVQNNSCLSFFPGGGVMYRFQDSLNTGHWKMDKSQAIYIIMDGDGRQIWIDKAEIKSKSFSGLLHWDNNQCPVNMYADGLVHKNPDEEPWQPANNMWRRKPQAEETQAQLKDRVRNYLSFLSKLLKDQKYRGNEVISWRGVPMAIRFYSNGIGMLGADDIEKPWLNCFYSPAQAMEGYEILRQVMVNSTSNCENIKDSWVLVDACFLEGLRSAIK